MGGNIWKSQYPVKRLTKAEYESLCITITKTLEVLKITKFHIVQSVKDKQDFGDLDIVVESTAENYQAIRNWTSKLCPTPPESMNGNVYSFLYNLFQIDVIFVKDYCYEYACNYFDWNDFGNIVGRLLKYHGFKHGWQGLYYVQKDSYEPSRILYEHLLSLDYNDALTLLQLDIEVFKQGFDTKLEMFDYISNSPLFVPEIYKLSNLNNKDKTRDKKRKTYNEFLEYLDKKYFTSEKTGKLIPEDLLEIKTISNEDKLTNVSFFYPEVLKDIKMYQELANSQRQYRNKFNGRVVQSIIPELSGKELGGFIKFFNSKYEQSNILLMMDDVFNQLVLDTYKEFGG